MSNLPTKLTEFDLTSKDFVRTFDQNYLEIIDRLHADVPMRYKLDFIQKACLSGADPRLDQIYLTSYWSSKMNSKVGVVVYSYNFFMAKATETNEYRGVQVNTQVEELFNPISGEVEKQLVSTATVRRQYGDECIETSDKAIWKECFNPKNSIWKDRPYGMLEKTAVAKVIRKAFPEVMKGMIVKEEVSGEHIEESEKILEQEKAIETTAKTVVKEKEIIEKNKSRGTKKPLIEAITVLCSSITANLTKEEKIDFMNQQLLVTSMAALEKRTVKELQGLLEKLTDIEQNKPTEEDLPY